MDHWIATLESVGVDDIAQKELVLLAQHSKEGAQGANGIIAKVLKKVSDGDEVKNWSALVHVMVKDQRHKLTWEDWHAGGGKNQKSSSWSGSGGGWKKR